MGKVADQFKDVVGTETSDVKFVSMWVGPRNAKEIEKTLANNPTLVPCACSPRHNDGRGVQGYKERKGYMTIQEMHNWIAGQKPEEQKFPCPYCEDDENRFIANSAVALTNHINKHHKPSNVVSTPDFDGGRQAANDAAADKAVEKALRGKRIANDKE